MCAEHKKGRNVVQATLGHLEGRLGSGGAKLDGTGRAGRTLHPNLSTLFY